jgi:5-methylcytosine-specific restriction protein B
MARFAEAPAVYHAADLFRQRCLVDGTSLLWPDHRAWTVTNLDALWDAFMGHPDEGKRNFMEKWRDQLAEQPAEVHRIAADLMAFYYLFAWNIGTTAKRNGLREVISWKLAAEGEPPGMPEVDAAFEQRIGHTGIYYLTGRPWQIAYYLEFARQLIRDGVDPLDRGACQRLADRVHTAISGSHAARHILLHLLFPDDYEGIASGDHKHRIVAAFPAHAGRTDDVDEAIRNIRSALDDQLERTGFSFYESDTFPLWNPPGATDPIETPPSADGETTLPGQEPTLDDLAAATFLPVTDLQEIEALLRERRQIVFEGPPGSGKTYVAELVARWFAGLPLGGPTNDQFELVQFHQSYGYEDFVQGIRPETDPSGQLRYRVRDGIFKRLCEIAARNLDRPHVLVIDEINRGNTARIFGELLLLLEYRDKRARLPYAAPDAGDEAYLSIPENLYVIGTMNSTDRSLAQVDYALRRRFYFRRFQPVENGRAPVLDGWLAKHDVPDADRQRLARAFVSLNRLIEEHLSADFQLGHSYFMVPDIATSTGLDRVWRRAVRPLMEEYFHHHRDRDTILTALHRAMFASGSSVGDVAVETQE